MSSPSPSSAPPSFVDLFTPKLATVLREGYGMRDLRTDALAGLTVAIVALPLSMAIAIASGVSPDRGLYTAIVGGFFVSALGGSRFQIGGPAGAFIVLVAGTVATYGVDGLILATAMSGLILLAMGFLRLGTFIKYVPYPVTVGFTAGIAAIIFASQIRALLGLSLPDGEPGPIVPKIAALAAALPTVSVPAVAVAAATVAVILGLRRTRPHWPGMLIGVALASLAAVALSLPVETIGTRFGGIPRALPAPGLPDFNLARLFELLPAAVAFALLGSIESLLSAVVADSMTGRRHRSNCELVAQGTANVASALFGGFCVTGTIARTATNVRSGARGPIAGMLHSAFLLLFMLVAAPLAAYIPLAALAGVLAVVAWNMAEKHEFATLLRTSRGDAVVLLATFLLTVFRDLTEGILVGVALSAMLFLHRMAQEVEVEGALRQEDVADDAPGGDGRRYDTARVTDPDIAILRISGAFFFGAASKVATALDRIRDAPRAYILDLSGVPLVDSTGAATLAAFVRKVASRKASVHVVGARAATRSTLAAHGIAPPAAQFHGDLEAALAAARGAIGGAPLPGETASPDARPDDPARA